MMAGPMTEQPTQTLAIHDEPLTVIVLGHHLGFKGGVGRVRETAGNAGSENDGVKADQRMGIALHG